MFISCLSDGAPAMLGFHARIMPEADQGTAGLIKFALPEEKGARRLVLAPAQAGVGRPLAQGFSPGKRTANVPEKIGSAFKNMVESLGHHGTESLRVSFPEACFVTLFGLSRYHVRHE
jgi:hypothetical protein